MIRKYRYVVAGFSLAGSREACAKHSRGFLSSTVLGASSIDAVDASGWGSGAVGSKHRLGEQFSQTGHTALS